MILVDAASRRFSGGERATDSEVIMTPHGRDQRKAHWFRIAAAFALAGSVACNGSIGSHGAGTGSGIGASTGAGAGIGTGTGGAGGFAAPGVYAPAPPALRLLTVGQYQNSMRALLGSTITLPADLELDTVLNGFASIGASRVDLSPLAVEQLEAAALAAAKQVLSDTANRGTLVGCTPAGTTDDTCARSFVRSFGRRAWRRPLADEEITRYAGIANNAETMLGNFYGGLEYALAGLLQSPHFIYRTEVGEPDPQDPSRRVLNGYEVATRLSYFLSATTPDDTLLDAAAGGSLAMTDGLRSAAQRLVDAPAARTAAQSFFTELLRLGELNNLSQLPSIFPAAMSPTLGTSMRTETLRVLEDIAFTRDADYRTLFETPNTFVNGELAKIYGLTSTDRNVVRGDHARRLGPAGRHPGPGRRPRDDLAPERDVPDPARKVHPRSVPLPVRGSAASRRRSQLPARSDRSAHDAPAAGRRTRRTPGARPVTASSIRSASAWRTSTASARTAPRMRDRRSMRAARSTARLSPTRAGSAPRSRTTPVSAPV